MPSTAKSLYSPYPEFQIGRNGILHKNDSIARRNGMAQLLHGKRVSGRPRPYPIRSYTMIPSRPHMRCRSHLHAHRKPRLLLSLSQPGQRLLTPTLKTAWPRARLPHPSPVEIYTPKPSQLARTGQHLLGVLCRAGACHH